MWVVVSHWFSTWGEDSAVEKSTPAARCATARVIVTGLLFFFSPPTDPLLTRPLLDPCASAHSYRTRRCQGVVAESSCSAPLPSAAAD